MVVGGVACLYTIGVGVKYQSVHHLAFTGRTIPKPLIDLA
jgi:hypothetical protein